MQIYEIILTDKLFQNKIQLKKTQIGKFVGFLCQKFAISMKYSLYFQIKFGELFSP